jgi:hypothetical protein
MWFLFGRFHSACSAWFVDFYSLNFIRHTDCGSIGYKFKEVVIGFNHWACTLNITFSELCQNVHHADMGVYILSDSKEDGLRSLFHFFRVFYTFPFFINSQLLTK